MRWTDGVCVRRFTHQILNRRIVTEIQGNVAKRGKRNAISRLIHAKDDRKAIDTWRSDLNKILHVFNVRSVTSAQSLLTLRFQTELEMNTHLTVVANNHSTISDVYHDISNTDPAPDIVHNGPNTHSEINHNMSKSREDAGGQNPKVSTLVLYLSPSNQCHRLDSR